jgi:hypothetical protein
MSPGRGAVERIHELLEPQLSWRFPAAFRWGFRLGLGFCTYLVTPAFYALLAVALGQMHPAGSWLLCMVYGAARGIVIAWSAVTKARIEARGDPLPTPKGRLKRALRVPLLVMTVLGVTLVAVGRP